MSPLKSHPPPVPECKCSRSYNSVRHCYLPYHGVMYDSTVDELYSIELHKMGPVLVFGLVSVPTFRPRSPYKSALLNFPEDPESK